jgi:transposase
MVDALGDLVNFVLLPGQRHDLIGAPPLLVGVEFEALIADKTYDSNELRAQLPACGATVVIPPRANRVEVIEYDSEMYKWRHLVENFFCKLKNFRRIAMRFEKTDVSYAAMIHAVSSRLALA